MLHNSKYTAVHVAYGIGTYVHPNAFGVDIFFDLRGLIGLKDLTGHAIFTGCTLIDQLVATLANHLIFLLFKKFISGFVETDNAMVAVLNTDNIGNGIEHGFQHQ